MDNAFTNARIFYDDDLHNTFPIQEHFWPLFDFQLTQFWLKSPTKSEMHVGESW